MSTGILEEATPSVKRTNWFLGIGIDNYIEFPKLFNAVKDVQDIRQLLMDQYDFQEAQTITLFDEQANEENIISTLDRLADKLSRTDTLLIYYSGHGHMTNKGLGYWIPQDAKRGNTARYISNSRIRDAIGTLDAQHVFLISDSCFSGSLLTKGASRSTRLVRELDDSPSRWALCSGRSDEEVDDGAPGTNSPFASSIKNVLAGNEEDALNASKVVDRVREQVAANSNQIPEGHPIQDVGHGWGEYIFRKKGGIPSAEIRNIEITQPISRQEQVITQRQPHTQNITTETTRVFALPSMKKIFKWIGIVLGIAAATVFALTYFTSDLPKLKLDVQKETVAISATGGTPWKSRGKDANSYELSVKQTDGKVLFTDLLASNSTFHLGFALLNDQQGRYEVMIKDSLGFEVYKTFTIPESYQGNSKPSPEGPSVNIQISAFQTSSGMNFSEIGKPWPVDERNQFKTGEEVYAYAYIASEEHVSFHWDGRGISDTAKKIALDKQGYWLYDVMTYKSPGTFSVKLLDSSGAVLKMLEFSVIEYNDTMH